jgi:hypothetical protein
MKASVQPHFKATLTDLETSGGYIHYVAFITSQLKKQLVVPEYWDIL